MRQYACDFVYTDMLTDEVLDVTNFSYHIHLIEI